MVQVIKNFSISLINQGFLFVTVFLSIILILVSSFFIEDILLLFIIIYLILICLWLFFLYLKEKYFFLREIYKRYKSEFFNYFKKEKKIVSQISMDQKTVYLLTDPRSWSNGFGEFLSAVLGIILVFGSFPYLFDIPEDPFVFLVIPATFLLYLWALFVSMIEYYIFYLDRDKTYRSKFYNYYRYFFFTIWLFLHYIHL